MARQRTSSIPELLLRLDRAGPEALHRQLERELQAAIRFGRLLPGAPLPSTRALAAELGISRGVVVEAFEQLVAEGYLEARPGGKTRVARRVGGRVDRRLDRRLDRRSDEPDVAGAPGDALDQIPNATPRRTYDFSYGQPDVTSFPRAAWLRSLRRVLTEAPADRLGYLDARGTPELREALASYLNRVRATSAVADRLVVTSGFAQAQRLIFHVLRDRGARRIAMEDPGQLDTRLAAEQLGLEIVPVPVDDDGIVVERLAGVRAAVCVVTPAHEFPTGAVLSSERRAALVRWARDRDALVLEDDYDAEYRYDREPIGAIQGLAPDRVIYAGSASKTVAPGLRLGWLILPPALVAPFAVAKYLGDRGTPSLEQLAFADFLEHGEFDRHLRRMRPIYRARRDALLAALATHLPAVMPVGASAGLHVLARLPAGVDEGRVVELAAGVDVGVDGLAPYRVAPGPANGGVILGYARLTEAGIAEGVRRLASAVEAAGA